MPTKTRRARPPAKRRQPRDIFLALLAGERRPDGVDPTAPLLPLSVTAAAIGAGLGRSTVYAMRDRDPAFRRAWDEAEQRGADRLEDAAVQFAMSGSEKLLIKLLESRRPEKYRASYVHHHHHDVNPDEQRAAIAEKLAKARKARAAAATRS